MKTFKHIIITRFNLSKRWHKDKLGNEVLNKTWLDDRYELFEKYCLPSIQGQTNQNFEWLVYFDENMDSFYKIKNDEINLNYKNFIPKYEVSYSDFEKNMPKELYDKTKLENIDFLITTRIDNDDMFAKDTISLIQERVKFKELSLLEIPSGYNLQISDVKKCRLRKVINYKNPFISLVEKIDKDKPVKTVFCNQHNKWNNIESQIISEKEQWIQIIHDKNVLNGTHGIEVLDNDLYNQFSFGVHELKFDFLINFKLRMFILGLKRYLFRMKRKLKFS